MCVAHITEVRKYVLISSVDYALVTTDLVSWLHLSLPSWFRQISDVLLASARSSYIRAHAWYKPSPTKYGLANSRPDLRLVRGDLTIDSHLLSGTFCCQK